MVKRLSEIRDEAGRLTHKMCCYCFEYVPFGELWVDDDGQRWDACEGCGLAEQEIAKLKKQIFG